MPDLPLIVPVICPSRMSCHSEIGGSVECTITIPNNAINLTVIHIHIPSNNMMKFHFTFYLAFATSFVAVTASNFTSTIQFPRIYVAEINTPAGKEQSAISRFPAEVDLLDYDRINDKIHKISFLVHDEQELVSLVALAKKTKSKTINETITLDLSATDHHCSRGR